METAKQLFKEAGQGQVFEFFDLLTETQQQSLLDQLKSFPTPTDLKYMFTAAVSPAPTSAEDPELIAPTDTDIVQLPHDALDESTEAVAAFHNAGLAAIRKGQCATLILAGGQGSRLGTPVPKGTVSIGLPSNASLFELLFKRHLKAVAVANADTDAGADAAAPSTAPIIIMTSPATHTDTVAFLKEHDCFGAGELAVAPFDATDDKVRAGRVFVFQQGQLPAFDADGKILLSEPAKVAVAPDGNGGLWTSNDWAALVEFLSADRAVEWIHCVNVDNALCRVLDPVHIGAAVVGTHEIVAKIVPKATPAEAVGVFARRPTTAADGAGWGVVEYSELTDAQKKDPALGVGANVGMYVFSTGFIRKAIAACTAAVTAGASAGTGSVCALHAATNKKTGSVRRRSVAVAHIPPLPVKRARKNEAVLPPEPHETTFYDGVDKYDALATKLERFIFDPFPLAASVGFLSCVRAAEFAPVKAADGGTSVDTPTRARELVLALHARWVKVDGKTAEVCPSVTYAGEGAPFDVTSTGVCVAE